MAVRALPRAITSCATSFNDSPNSFDIARTTSALSATNHATRRLATAPGAERVRPRSHYALHGYPCIHWDIQGCSSADTKQPGDFDAADEEMIYNLGSLAVDFSFVSISHNHGKTRNTKASAR